MINALLTGAQITVFSLGISTRSIEMLIPPTVSSKRESSSSLFSKQMQKQKQKQPSLIVIDFL